jgi:hypothetical protein
VLAAGEVAFLLDVDSTLLDSDRFAADLGARLEQGFGAAGRDRYWALYAKLRDELGYEEFRHLAPDFGSEVPVGRSTESSGP